MNSIFLQIIFSYFAFAISLHAQKEVISTEAAPKAIGPYSQAIIAGNFVFVSGQIALDPSTGKMIEGEITEQTHQVMKNISAILHAKNLNFSNIVQVQVYLKDLNDYVKFNEIYAQYFAGDFPARAVVEVSRLPRNALVEVLVTAVHF